MENSQMKRLGKTLAETVMLGAAWEEPLNGDEIEDLVISFMKELAESCGEGEDLFVQDVLRLQYNKDR